MPLVHRERERERLRAERRAGATRESYPIFVLAIVQLAGPVRAGIEGGEMRACGLRDAPAWNGSLFAGGIRRTRAPAARGSGWTFFFWVLLDFVDFKTVLDGTLLLEGW